MPTKQISPPKDCKKNSNKNISHCPYCESVKVIKKGLRKTENRGSVQRFYCKDCKRRFVDNSAFYRMRNSPRKITLCLDLFFRGISTRKTQEHLEAFYPHNSTHKSIYKWVIKYSNLISNFTDTLKPTLGWEVQVDEMEYHRRKHPKKHSGIDKNWFIDSVDTKTRFLVASQYAESRTSEELKGVIKTIKNKGQGRVKIVTTDGLTAYRNVVNKTFGYSLKLGRYTVFHNVVCARQGEGFNYPIERLHNTIRHRTKTFRGFHGSADSARAIMKGIEIYYNYITKHQGIDKRPCEEAKIDIELGHNRWLGLIELAENSV